MSLIEKVTTLFSANKLIVSVHLVCAAELSILIYQYVNM